MPLNVSSQAAAVGASANNTQFKSGANVMPRKTLITGTYDPAITTIANDTPSLVTSSAQAGSTYGWGFMLHELVTKSMLGSGGGETWVLPQAETGAAAAAAGSIAVTVSATENGVLYFYVAGRSVKVAVTNGDSAAIIAASIAAAFTAQKECLVTATSAAGVVTVTSKSKGPWGNSIDVSLNLGYNEETPAGVTIVITPLSGGSGVPSMSNALNALGTGDAANEAHYTDIIHGYMQDTTTLDALSTYNGEGNGRTGLYSKTVARPFRSLVGDTAVGATGLSALLSLADSRKTDRTNGVVAAPGSPEHPAALAAQALGILCRLNANRAEEHALDQLLSGVLSGATADRWTNDYDSRDTAVKGGVGTTLAKNGALYIQNLVTFYRPDDVPVTSNGYKSMRNISILQNILFSTRQNFSQAKWKGVSLVADTAKVADIIDRQKARDVEAVKDDLIALAISWRDHAWVYEIDKFTIPNLQIAVRAGLNGFNAIIKIILSGEVGIIDTSIEFDTSIDILL
jgi:phage tail sheath gpL-like